MTEQPGLAAGAEREIGRRTITYAVSIVLVVIVMIVALVVLGSRRGECFDTDVLVCSRKDRRLLVFLPSVTLLVGAVGAFLRASPRWHRTRRLSIRSYVGWILVGLAVAYGAASFSFLF
ncbi:hypothetical protein C7T36_23905 [Rhodococcus sp. AD45-ID]|uniref:Uncharacterized protein n=1 Tax=Nocardia globerula TaxID=1818 RepID=A0A652YNC6_NOCGL|nr:MULTISPECIES: hypothetical protein [Rhodococcus]NMD62540.1 hypothetical protein [Nocardia globerula]KJF23057.1 hypothetical protein SZ00_03712 [Rhodococcus sp. AD45]NRI64808.1 hypothetical protein [Rhodococcus sp. MS16]PSR40571.1 hypothetical protein C7T36_23905 [Rhodococcus sp. AD45-ID]PVX65355.1 hypothetical protein C8E04_2652 [Rhodococcus globerulus]